MPKMRIEPELHPPGRLGQNVARTASVRLAAPASADSGAGIAQNPPQGGKIQCPISIWIGIH
jgi:hypothetical protein